MSRANGFYLPACLLLGLVVAFLPLSAGAQKAGETYYVVQIYPEGFDGIVVNLGQGSGAQAGQKVRIYRAIETRHPVTGKRLRDRFPLGDLEIIEVGKTLSICEDMPYVEDEEADVEPGAKGKTASIPRLEKRSRIKVGDQAELLGAAPVVYTLPAPTETKPAPWSWAKPGPSPAGMPPAAAECPPCPETEAEKDTATTAVLAAFNQTLGKSPSRRIEIWKMFMLENPNSPYTEKVTREIGVLKLEQAKSRRLAVAKPKEPGVKPLLFKHYGPKKLYQDEPLQVALLVSELERVRSADVFYRKNEAATYKKKPMKRDGDAYLRAELPPDELAPPGMDYFVEAADQKGEVHRAVGSKEAPKKVEVEEPPGLIQVKRQERSKVSLLFEHANFMLVEKRPDGPDVDRFMRVEADFLYRILTILYSIRVGFGVYTGEGGEIDQPGSKEVGFNYGYTELEFRFHEYFSVMGKAILGLTQAPGEQDPEGLAAGVEGKIRIGRELGTNLVLGGAILQDIGSLGLIELTWDVVEYFPMTGRVEVTTQPVGKDIGVRIIYQLGLSALDWFQPTLHFGLAIRRIDHYGMSFGLGTVFQW